MASEFELIKSCFEPLSKGLSAEEIGIGDDGAVLSVPANHQLVVVTDTLVSGVHFPEDTPAYDIAWKALAVNLSDLAAMGARPGFYSLALTIPHNDQAWLNEFSAGLAALSEQYQIPLIGGDTTKGPLTVTVTAQGFVKTGQALKRSTAKNGDLICVTNTIGDGALGLKVALNNLPGLVEQALSIDEKQFLLKALNRPEPQLAMNELLNSVASSAIDISDGLLADLTHVLNSSSQCLQKLGQKDACLGAQIHLDKLPLSDAAQKYLQATGDWSAMLTGGDDYQLCFTIAESDLAKMQGLAKSLNLNVSVIGEVVGTEVVLVKQGKPFNLESGTGYLHFR